MASAEDPTAAEGGQKESKSPETATNNGEASEPKAEPAAAAPDETNAAPDADDAAPASVDDDDEKRPSDSAQPSSKKRRSNIQLNKDDHPEGHTCDSDDNDELNDEGGKRSDPFKRASEDVLKKRKIVKASSKWSSGGNGGKAAGGGTFSSVNLAAPAAEEGSEKGGGGVFGSGAKVPTFGSAAGGGSSGLFGGTTTKAGGFGSGFGSVSGGFGALKSSSSSGEKKDGASNGTSAFGGGFGSVSSGFGSLKSTAPTFGFGSASSANAASPNGTAGASNGSGLGGTFANSSSKPSSASPSKFPTSSVVDTANGEQDEDCLCQVRAKLFKMVPEDETAATEEDGSALKGDVPSVPSTSGRMELVKKKETDEGSPDKSKDASPEKSKESPNAGEEEENKQKMVQKEAGIGPVRVLKRKAPIVLGDAKEDKGTEEETTPAARVVQRQETSGGQATRVILNIRLVPKTCNVIRRGDKFVQLNAPNSKGELESSLFKVKTTADADMLEKNLKAMLEVEA